MEGDGGRSGGRRMGSLLPGSISSYLGSSVHGREGEELATKSELFRVMEIFCFLIGAMGVHICTLKVGIFY